jgi:hypothetical protein
VLTFRKGAASALPGGARAMADHLMEETLSPEAVAIGDYYTRNRAAELGAGPGPDGEAGPETPNRATRPQPRRDMHPGLAAALGIEAHGTPTVEQVSQILAGQRADGTPLQTNNNAGARSVSYIDLCFSAPKSVSLAWAFAPTEAERASILQAHRDAVDASLRYVAREIGQVRRGKAGAGGSEVGHVAWINFEHFTARPTAEVKRADPTTGEVVTELHTGLAATLAAIAAAGHANIPRHVAQRGVHGVTMRLQDRRPLGLGGRKGPGQADALGRREAEVDVADAACSGVVVGLQWRPVRPLPGEDLADLLHGRRAMRVDPQRRRQAGVHVPPWLWPGAPLWRLRSRLAIRSWPRPQLGRPVAGIVIPQRHGLRREGLLHQVIGHRPRTRG